MPMTSQCARSAMARGGGAGGDGGDGGDGGAGGSCGRGAATLSVYRGGVGVGSRQVRRKASDARA